MASGAPIEGGKLFAIPFDLNRGPLERHTALLDHLCSNPLWFAAAASPDEIRVNAAYMMTDPSFWKWEVWSAGDFVGMLLLSKVVPRLDAVFHFTFLPASSNGGTTLFGSRRLLWNFLGYVFEAFDLQRISVEVPEGSVRLAHFLRQRLGFKYEGELDLDRLRKSKGLVRHDIPGAASWIAQQGSRREQAHWDGTKWSDVLLLRLLRSEYITRLALGEMPKATRDSSLLEVSSVASNSAGGAVSQRAG